MEQRGEKSAHVKGSFSGKGLPGLAGGGGQVWDRPPAMEEILRLGEVSGVGLRGECGVVCPGGGRPQWGRAFPLLSVRAGLSRLGAIRVHRLHK